MNKKIEVLAKRAGMSECALGYGMPEDVLWGRSEIEAFAVSILQECIDLIEKYEIPVGNSPAGEMACEMTYSALKDIRSEIKKTFGVE